MGTKWKFTYWKLIVQAYLFKYEKNDIMKINIIYLSFGDPANLFL
jgi:hypothetical protein